MPSKCFLKSSSYNQPREPDLDGLVAPGPDTFSGHPAKLVWATVFPLFREEPIFACKAPRPARHFNTVWGDPSLGNVHQVLEWFHTDGCKWMLGEHQEDRHLLAAGFQFREPCPEMVMDLQKFPTLECSGNSKVILARTPESLEQWLEGTSSGFGLPLARAEQTFLPLIQATGASPFLILRDGVAVATALLSGNTPVAGIYGVSTREGHRNQGLGRTVTEACLRRAKDLGSDFAVLYSSAMALGLYQELGFQTVRMLREYRPVWG